MSSNTDKLKLLKVDPVADGEQYFNIDTMLNDNWDRVDTYAQDMTNKVDGNLLPRLNTVKTKDITLQPGLQIINAEKTSPFQLTNVKGRTLLNLTGSDWTPTKNITRFSNYQSTLSVDNNKSVTSGNALKITATVANSIADGFGKNVVNLVSGKKYIALGHLYNETGQSMKLVIQNTAIESPVTTSKNKWEFVYIPFTAGGNVSNAYPIARLNASAVGNAGYADGLRLYEISDAEYATLATMTSEQIAAAYPYVDSISPVRNPYVIAYGENLLPALQEWSNTEGTPVINNRYSVDVSSTNKIIHNSVAVVPGATYTLSAVSSGSTGRIFVYNTNGSVALADSTGSGTIFATFKVPVGVNVVEVRVLGTSTTAVNLSNLMLNIGTTANAFVPREDSMLALQTDLYADPVTGANADEVFEKDGQYFKLSKWKKIILDGDKKWVLGDAQATNGSRQVKISGLTTGALVASGISIKFDGKLILQGSTGSIPDTNAITAAGDLYISISIADSGWSDTYTPTSDEIKAYFLGWKMYDSSDSSGNTSYNRTDGTNKAWTPLASYNNINYSGATTTVPLVKPETSGIVYRQSREVNSYQLVYRLNKPDLEPLLTEGELLLKERSNQVEVGTGIILRETAKPNMPNDNWFINQNGSSLFYKTTRILKVYKNNKQDNAWLIRNHGESLTAQGGGDAYIPINSNNYDPKATYTITYITNERSPLTNFIGSYALNEKTILEELIKDVQQSNTRLSIVENKKINQYTSTWITPTIFLGWEGALGFGYRIEGNRVYLQGILRGGTPTPTGLIFTMPEQYRTKRGFTATFGSYTASTSSTVAIDFFSNGRVSFVTNTAQLYISFEGFSYPLD
ncbi:hypothetical protein PQ460_18265 [Paenibacillus sp. KACC 21273]|uniref:hypothetical protein n=1 Tax=Paenibacillus sp. KACC 21273 TaxID=3025665 RepID=UPI00236624DB|nr:hypothetical protein [Paenibacillus sp. KACC 21273]WDF49919.1 hypothetical protein PQ460_18265 [Paenibacillus sp. KACC 21273]